MLSDICPIRNLLWHMFDDLNIVVCTMSKHNIEGRKRMKKQIRVWDPLVRVFHWCLVVAFCIAYLSGDEENDMHLYAGYVVFALIGFRILWGLIGTRFARFSNFVYSPGSVIKYIKDAILGRPKHYLGHNPAGGAMVIALLLSLVVVTYSGLKVYAIEEGAGPLAQQAVDVSFIKSAFAGENKHEEHEEEEFWEEIHQGFANFVLFLAILHIAGVFVVGRLHGENLVKGMITGNKKIE